MAEQPPKQRRKLSAILMADVSGFSRMMGADEVGMTALIREFHTRTKSIVEGHEGRVVDTAGDSVFGEFDSVVNAMRCAQEIQRAQAVKNSSQPNNRRIETRIGLHVGDVIVEEYQIYGDGVNIAARLESMAEPGGICVSEAVFQQVRNKLPVEFEDLGIKELKNIEFPLHLYQVPPEIYMGADHSPDEPDNANPDETTTVKKPHARYAIVDELLETENAVKLALAVFLLLCPIFLFHTSGVFPTIGGVIASRIFGRAWARHKHRPGNYRIAVGIGWGCGAAFTDWSIATDIIFLTICGYLVIKGYNQNKKLK